MPSFNLADQPWIPALAPDDPVPRSVSLREALCHAHEFEAISDPSPLVTLSLARLLLAIAHRCFGPVDAAAWRDLWDRGRFDMDVINAYFDKWHDRFDLFSAERPFYQTPGLPEGKASPSSILIHEVGVILFDHSEQNGPISLSPSAAARAVVTLQGFDMGGTVWREPNAKSPSAAATQLMGSAVFLAMGDTLFETLLLNMVRVDPASQIPFGSGEIEDRPAWEQDARVTIETRDPYGYLDFLTWQSRRILLFPSVTDDGLWVPRAIVGAGRRFSDDLDLSKRERMVPFSLSTRAKPPVNPMQATTFTPERALWRDSRAILGFEGTQKPFTLDWLGQLSAHGYLEKPVVRLFVGGAKPVRQKKIVRFWRGDQIELPTKYLKDPGLVTVLAEGLTAAEAADSALRRASYRLAAQLLEPDGSADSTRVNALIESLAPERVYWPALDIPFRRHIRQLPDDIDASNALLAEDIERAAVAAFDSACDAAATNGRGFRAVAEASPAFRAFLRRAIRPLLPEPEEVPA